MSVTKKLLDKLTTEPPPRNFHWDDLVSLLRRLGYQEITGSGSRRKFIHSGTNHILILHEPHPHHDLKIYQVRIVVDALKRNGLVP